MSPNSDSVLGGVPETHEQLIGVELTYTDPSGRRREVKMIAIDDVAVATSRTGGPRFGGGYATMQVTLHMTNGDRAAVIQL